MGSVLARLLACMACRNASQAHRADHRQPQPAKQGLSTALATASSALEAAY